jgi:hypothetical protein
LLESVARERGRWLVVSFLYFLGVFVGVVLDALRGEH